MKRIYITVKGEVREYDYPKFKPKRKRPKCPNCRELAIVIKVQVDSKYTKLGYYCRLCKIMYMDRKKGKIFECDIE